MTQTTPIPKEELELFKQLTELKVIFDVGAREDTDYLDIWPDSEHHLFEPNPQFYPVFKNFDGLWDFSTSHGHQGD